LKITLVETNVYRKILPLVSGYLKTFAETDSAIRDACDIEIYARHLSTDRNEMLGDLVERRSDVYAFPTYMWNSRVVQFLARSLLARRPDARILLGGPQVMNYGARYLLPEHEGLVVCNGVGEPTFLDYLREVVSDRGDYARVRGLSFYRDGELVTNPDAEPVRDINAIPSPYLTGVFDDFPASSAAFETTRGCPYKCSFCYFSELAEGAKVTRFDLQRVKDELTWLAERSCLMLFMADANWGIFPRDVEIAEHMVKLRQHYKLPRIIYYSSSKNRPEQVTKLAEVYARGGMVSAQPVSLQSLNDETLEATNRKNISQEKYQTVQQNLIEKDIPSFVELIWPLPRETLETFTQGIDTLCGRGVDTISMYPLILLNSTKLSQEREKWGLETVDVPDENTEAEIVLSTNTVTREECEEGHRFYYATHVLYNIRTLGCLSRYLSQERGIPSRDFFASFADYYGAHPDSVVGRFAEGALRDSSFYEVTQQLGMLAHYVLHENREEFAHFLHGFASKQPWWDAESRVLFEIDLFNAPYIYNNTPIPPKEHFDGLSSTVEIVESTDIGHVIEMPERYQHLVHRYVDRSKLGDGPCSTISVDHERPVQMSFARVEDAAVYCAGMIQRVRHLLPLWGARS
jgi:radical SAM superfamily enzyme YgiQ (UPF0313 family)